MVSFYVVPVQVPAARCSVGCEEFHMFRIKEEHEQNMEECVNFPIFSIGSN